MARKIKIDDNTYKCPACDYRWSKTMGMADLSFDEDAVQTAVNLSKTVMIMNNKSYI